jgi:Virulence factor SrfB
MSSNHRITDAKTVTAVGAALYSAIRNGLIDHWSITCAEPVAAKVRNYWGLMPTDDEATGFGADPYLDDKQDSKRVELLVNSYIGRMRYLTCAARPEQQYKLVWKNPEDMIAKRTGTRLEVEIVRRVDSSTGQEMGLELGASLRALDGGVEVTKDDLILQLCTLEGGEFWIDSGRFEIQW